MGVGQISHVAFFLSSTCLTVHQLIRVHPGGCNFVSPLQLGPMGSQKTCPAKYSSHNNPGPAALLLNLDQLHLPLQPILGKNTWCLFFPKGDGDIECVYSLYAAKPKVRCLFTFVSNAVGGRGRIDCPEVLFRREGGQLLLNSVH